MVSFNGAITHGELLTDNTGDAELWRTLQGWNATAHPYPEHLCIHQLFEAQVARTPHALAAVCGAERLSFTELNQQANRVAIAVQQRGVGPEVRVGVCMARSLDLVVALLAVLKAGGAYVPLDPAYPAERLLFMLRDSGAELLLVDSADEVAGRLGDWGGAIYPLAQARAEGPPSDAAPNAGVRPDNLAYLIYTSGSTGVPKGVAIEHRNSVAMLDWASRTFTADEIAGVLAGTSICFDLSIFEIFLPLCYGGGLIVAENGLHVPTVPPELPITMINTVPSVMAMLLRGGELPPTVQVVNLAGEPLPPKLVREVYAQTSARRVVNLYGPSETTTYSTYAVLPPDIERPPPIGRPIDNTTVYLLDEQRQPVPIGEVGEIYIGGAGVARGYLNRPELTAERFLDFGFWIADFGLSDDSSQSKIQNPKSKMYKTGDLARYRPDGVLEFLGRIDHQVKIRGFRIELGEIEAVLTRHPAVRDCVVAAQDDTFGDKCLVAYVVAQSDDAGTADDPVVYRSALITFLRQSLPDYMNPSVFVILKAFPLTPNGKVDRKALPAPDWTQARRKQAVVSPQTTLEMVLATMWSEVLALPAIGRDDHFFELGGHSLRATQIVSRVRKTFHIPITVRDVFAAPTVATLAQHLVAREPQPGRTEMIARTLQRVWAMSPAERQQALQQKKVT
ncbi:MAG: amino acid adenylation domain-containing protein [Chloroflexaceae bacterium]|jgi:amino acid adenylation domain-containing protein|nr:amino acid adenylation domain-containing protein [Chloroflexaceae bacterium]